jgi:signal transduction histidine kinase/CheY-like chemotaxis protein
MLYNDAYRPMLGTKHPASLSAPGHAVWPEIWHIIGPMLESVLQEGKATWSDDQFLPLERSGYAEECYFTFSYSPIHAESGAVLGVFTAVSETTERVLSGRRGALANDLTTALVDAHSTEDVCARAARILATDPADTPFALLYAVDPQRREATLLNAVGLAAGTALSPLTVPLDNGERASSDERQSAADPWALRKVMDAPRDVLVRGINWGNVALDVERSIVPHDALALPLIEPGQASPTAILVVGVSPRRMLDDTYHAFFTLLASHLSIGLAAAHAYEAEARRAEALAALDRAKTTFFSNVSHEFRTPLTLMLGPLEDSLADPALSHDPRQRERLEVMRRNGARLLKLVNTLLDFARIEAGRVQAFYEPTDICAYTTELASAFRSLVEKAGLALIVDCQVVDDLPAPVYLDREMWEKIVLNLLSNAFKFTFDGSITVALRPVAGDDGVATAVELMVRDTGTGIPATELPALFERFRRVEGARSRTYEGSGIGLALVQELVHLHGGTITVESAEGAGTSFYVRIPLGASRLPADRVAPSQPSELASTAIGAMAYVEEAGRWLANDAAMDHIANGRGDAAPLLDTRETPTKVPALNGYRASILVADDNSDMREYLRRLLSERFSVVTVANGAQALDYLQNHPDALPDLVLADVMMPEVDGFGLLRALRSDPTTATLPVMLLSARAGEEATVEGLEAGADDYLVKPFSGREVLSRIEARLEITRMRRAAERRARQTLDAILRMAQSLFEAPDDLPVAQSGADAIAEEEHLVAHRLAMLTCEVLGCQRVGIIAVEPESEALRAVALVGLSPEQERQWWAEQRAQEARGARLGEGADPDELARFRAGEVFVIDMSKPPYDAIPNPYQITTSLIAPMRAGDRLVGMLSLDYGGPPHTFTQDERALAAAVAHLGAVALEREHLLRVSAEAKAGELAAVESRRRMDDFMGIASHELRTPLTSITANVQMARRQLEGLVEAARYSEALTAEQRAQMDRMERSALLLERMDRQMRRMDRLVSDLVDSARIQAGKLELRPEACDLLAITQDAVHEQRSAWPHRRISLTLPRRATASIFADGDRIGQVVTNLLTNALKYSPDDAEVALAMRIQGDTVRVEVRDQGPGLSLKQQEHLFERFYRVPGVEQQSGSGVGLGLGLHICKNIIERHGGAIGVTSAPGKGSAFWFALPLQREGHRPEETRLR